MRPDRDLINIGWFSSGRGEGSRGLLSFIKARIDDGLLNANIQFVFSNLSKGEFAGSDAFLDLTDRLGIPMFTFSSDAYRQNYTFSSSFWIHTDHVNVPSLFPSHSLSLSPFPLYMSNINKKNHQVNQNPSTSVKKNQTKNKQNGQIKHPL